MKILACNIQNDYLTDFVCERIWTKAETKFGSDQDKNMIVVRTLYGLISNGATFRALPSKVLCDINHPDIYIYSDIKDNTVIYYEYMLCVMMSMTYFV